MKLAALRNARGVFLVSAVASALVVFFCHFRPWEVGLLEEWGFADRWNHFGWAVFTDPSQIELGRPLQNIAIFLALSPGLGILGVQLMLGLTAVGQFLVVLRFGSPGTSPRRWLSLIVALIVALHPLWPAGFILRYMFAQLAILATLGALSLVFRYLRGRSGWLLLPSAVLAVTALVTYQAPAAVLLLVTLALSTMLPSATMRRRILSPAVIVAAVALATLWSTVIAQKLVPSGATYESSLLSTPGESRWQAVKTLLHSVAHIPITLATRAPATIVATVLLLVILFVLHRRMGMTLRVTWTLAALTALSIFAGIPYALNPLHVLDPERVGGPAALSLGLVLMLWCLLSPPEAVRLQTAITGALLIATGVATAISLTYWGRYSSIQRSMLELIAPAVKQATGHQRVLIEDGTGLLGDVYTGYYPDLSASSHVYNDDPTNVVMCTIDGVKRQRPVAEIFPLTTTKYCSALPVPTGAHFIKRGNIAGGPVGVYIIGPSTGQDR